MDRFRPSSDTQGNAHGIALGYTLVWLVQDLSHCSRCTQMLMSIGHNLSCQLAAGRLEMLGKCMFEKDAITSFVFMGMSPVYMPSYTFTSFGLDPTFVTQIQCVSCIFNICTNCPSSSSSYLHNSQTFCQQSIPWNLRVDHRQF